MLLSYIVTSGLEEALTMCGGGCARYVRASAARVWLAGGMRCGDERISHVHTGTRALTHISIYLIDVLPRQLPGCV